MQVTFASNQGNGRSSTRDSLSKRGSGESKQTDPAVARVTYTKLSLTETTKTLPASLSLAELIYPGIWFSEQAGE
jgi:hypothetical protein